MIATKLLQKRLDRLEKCQPVDPDIVGMVLGVLSYTDLELLQERAALAESGSNEEQTASMMGDRYNESQKAVERFQKAYQELVEKVKLEGKGLHGL